MLSQYFLILMEMLFGRYLYQISNNIWFSKMIYYSNSHDVQIMLKICWYRAGSSWIMHKYIFLIWCFNFSSILLFNFDFCMPHYIYYLSFSVTLPRPSYNTRVVLRGFIIIRILFLRSCNCCSYCIHNNNLILKRKFNNLKFQVFV